MEAMENSVPRKVMLESYVSWSGKILWSCCMIIILCVCVCVYIHQKKFESTETTISMALLCNDIDDFACLFTCFLLCFSTSNMNYLFLFFLNLITLWFIGFLEHGLKPYLSHSVSRVSHTKLNSCSHNKTRVQLMWTLTIYSQVKY